MVDKWTLLPASHRLCTVERRWGLLAPNRLCQVDGGGMRSVWELKKEYMEEAAGDLIIQ